ncbi:MAG: hypothetical protein R6V04_04065 [bacterium]
MSSPPMQPNGGGGGSVGDTCPDEWSYDSWDECRWYHDVDTCADLCFGEYEEAGMSCEAKVGLLCADVRMRKTKYVDNIGCVV